MTDDASAAASEPAEPTLAPYLIETARSGRSRCRTCRRKIEKGKLRLGILLEGPFGTGYLWHHLTCAARRRIEDVEAAYELPAFEDGLQVPPLAELQALKERAEQHRERRKDPPYVERAPTERSMCKHCGKAIEKDTVRVVLAREVTFGSQVRSGPINVHPACVAAELEADDCATEVEGFAAAVRQRSDIDPAAVDEALAAIGDLDE